MFVPLLIPSSSQNCISTLRTMHDPQAQARPSTPFKLRWQERQRRLPMAIPLCRGVTGLQARLATLWTR